MAIFIGIIAITVISALYRDKLEKNLVVKEEGILLELKKVRHSVKSALWALPSAGGIWLTSQLSWGLFQRVGPALFFGITAALWAIWGHWFYSQKRGGRGAKIWHFFTALGGILTGVAVTIQVGTPPSLLMWNISLMAGTTVALSAQFYHRAEGQRGVGGYLLTGAFLALLTFSIVPPALSLIHSEDSIVPNFLTAFQFKFSLFSEAEFKRFFRAGLFYGAVVWSAVRLYTVGEGLFKLWRLQGEGSFGLLQPYVWSAAVLAYSLGSLWCWLHGYCRWPALLGGIFLWPAIGVYILWVEYADTPPHWPRPLSRWWFIFRSASPYLALYVMMAIPLQLSPF